MSFYTFCLFILPLAFGYFQCQSNEVYVKVFKQSKSYAVEESYEIWNGNTKLVTSPTFSDNLLESSEYCLPATTNNQYTLKLIDSHRDSWSAGSHVYVQGIFGNVVFKNFMHTSATDTYPLSLYYAFMRNELWKLTSGSVTGSWTDPDFDASSWSEGYLGFIAISVSGTQYFRKSFSTVPSIAAYELSLYYRHGVIAYLNGVEIFRDNMPAGPVTSETHATTRYTGLTGHSIIRPASEFSTTNVLSVEVHFVENQVFVDFDAYMALLASSIMDTQCYSYAYSVDITTSTQDSGIGVFDYTKNTAFVVTEPPATVTYSIPSNQPRAVFNGLGIWPNTHPQYAPRNFQFQGSNSVTSSDWTEILSTESATYDSQVMRVFRSYFTSDMYSNYRINLVSSSSEMISPYEIHPLVCNNVPPTSIEFAQSTYTYYTHYDPVNIKPIIGEFTNCAISPVPAVGLTFDPVTCTLSGVGNSLSAGGTFTITASLGGDTFTGSFQIVFEECVGTFTQVVRTYQTDTDNEGFNIIDRTTQETVLSVNLNTGAENYVEWSSFLCLQGNKYEIETLAGDGIWYPQSYLYVRALLDQESYETILRVRRDDDVSMPVDYFFNPQFVIPPYSSWHYKMGTVPANWYTIQTGTSGWDTKPAAGYPDSSNQIQLYKTTFNVASVTDIAGAVLSLKYQYGVIVYINDHEIFRKGVSGELSTSSVSSTSLSSVKFRQISFPISGSYRSGSFSNFIVVGSNTISIALVSSGASVKTSTFDAALRLMGDSTVIRNHDYTVTAHQNLLRTPTNVFDLYSGYDTYFPLCLDDLHITITFNDDRHEWLSSVSIQAQRAQSSDFVKGFTLQGKNAEDSTWTTIKQYSDLTWSQTGQRNRYWTLSTEAYNQYRFTNFVGSDPDDPCVWKFSTIQLIRDATSIDVPALSYPDTTIFKSIEMAELYPSSEYYTDFTITPALPEGIVMDPMTGMISGTTEVIQDPTTYSITAKKFSGSETSCTLTLDSTVCTGGKSLITLMARTDTYPHEMGFMLYQGRGTEGEVLRTTSSMTNQNSNTYFDYCLAHGVYTYKLLDSFNDGWTSPAGFYLSVDVGELKFAVGLVAGNSKIVTFSSYVPFQAQYDEWKVYKEIADVASNWNAIDFDDSTWTSMIPSAIGTSEAVTVYLRREITLDDVNSYNVLNVRVKFTGGVVAYFNGRLVARFNLDEDFTSESESMTLHDASVSSKFHIILSTMGAVTGKNVMAYEVHRALSQETEPIVFETTGIVDVNDCAFAVDSYSAVTGTTLPDDAVHSAFFDYVPHTKAAPPNDIGTYSEWTVENLEGSKFNTLGVESFTAGNNWGFSIYARFDSEEYSAIFEETGLSVVERDLTKFTVPVAGAGFKQFKLQFDYPSSLSLQISEYVTMFCKLSGSGVCPAMGDYPAVGDGEMSPASCETGYTGYSYRICENGILGEVHTEMCSYKAPLSMAYSSDRYIFVVGTQVTINPPTYFNVITKFSLGEDVSLPKGLTLNPDTGAITGVPTQEVILVVYTIYGENPAGKTQAEIMLTIRKGECKAEGKYKTTPVGETAIFECSTQGAYIGTQKRRCNLGAADGEWDKVSGACIPVFLIVIVIIVVIVVIIVIAFFILRRRKAKSTGGMKNKKKALPKQKEQPATKEVKV